ncbi:MAG TPA: S53 family peptidase [Candidatus Dormibacteraeota bacterium]|nr:S53 family peptidase [Candidatus Dormibacteraeota bacterium]HEV2475328.1 S53 family peptidase [Candidatus Dormibacteraeota bacterium]
MGFWRLPQSGVVARLAIGALGSGALLLAGQAQASASAAYGPAQLRAAYDVPADVTGAGKTIVIIAAFQSPAVKTDLAAFDPACGPDARLCLAVLPLDVPTRPAPSQFPWFIEESTDVEWAHAIAPGAHLVLVEAKTGGDADILSATKYAIDNNLGDVISMSFSEAESCPTSDFLADEHAAFERAVAQGITLVAASGNFGPLQHSCAGPLVPDVATPASDPLVTAVGGTDVTVDASTGAYRSELAWSGSGGGFSSVYSRPSYQAPFNKDTARGVPDVAWHASPNHPTLIVANGNVRPNAGTSIATAEWAGVVALADQAAGHRLGSLNELLYHAAKSNGESDRFHDISSGKRAWDAVTGLGTPDVANLVSWIAAHS